MKHKKPFTLQLADRMLLVTAQGVWTLADAKEYVRQMRMLVDPILAQQWAAILDCRAWQMSPAEVFSLLQDNTQWCFERNLMMAVTVLPDDPLLRWQFSKATAMEKPSGFISQFSDDVATAREAVRAAGYLS